MKHIKRSTACFYFDSTYSLLGPQLHDPFTNALWVGSHVGVGIYLYVSKHLRNADTFDRLLYRYTIDLIERALIHCSSSIYGSAIFNFGTVLVMSIVRSIFSDNEALRLGVGLSCSAGLLLIGRRYVQYIDQIFDAIRFRAISRP